MYKNIALIALLLPFSGYGITKEECKQKQARMLQIVNEVKKLEYEMHYIEELIKHNAWILFISGDAIHKSAVEAEEKLDSLNKEYIKLQQDIS